jgi:hypothetical protein
MDRVYHRAAFVTRLAAALTAIVLMVSGCSSMHRLPNPAATPEAPWPVRIGDHVRLTMRDGRQHELTIQAMDSDAIVAAGGARYDRREIQTVERRQFNGKKTTFLVGGLTAGALLMMIAVAEASLVGGLQ